MKIPAVILARGGSKGIKGKNLRQVGGISLIGRAVRAAKASRFSNLVYVYSDDREIQEEAARHGAFAPPRPASVSGDTATSEATMKAFLDEHDPDKNWGAAALVQATTPFLRAKHLNEVYEKMTTLPVDSVITATDAQQRYFGYPGQKKDLQFIPMRPYRTLRQEGGLEFWMENGGVYCAKRSHWDRGNRMGPVTAVVAMSWWESLEIDEPIDLTVAQSLAQFFDQEEEEHGVTWVRD